MLDFPELDVPLRWHVAHGVIVGVLGFLWLFMWTGLVLSVNAASDIGMNTAFVGILVMSAASGAVELALLVSGTQFGSALLRGLTPIWFGCRST